MMRSRLFKANAGQSLLASRQFSRWTGTVTQAVGLLIESTFAWRRTRRWRGARCCSIPTTERWTGRSPRSWKRLRAGWWTGFEGALHDAIQAV